MTSVELVDLFLYRTNRKFIWFTKEGKFPSGKIYNDVNFLVLYDHLLLEMDSPNYKPYLEEIVKAVGGLEGNEIQNEYFGLSKIENYIDLRYLSLFLIDTTEYEYEDFLEHYNLNSSDPDILDVTSNGLDMLIERALQYAPIDE